jgi:hypothetical protein
MKEYPFLCNARTVRAILDGRQTQDRRPMKIQNFKLDGGGHPYIDMGYPDEWDGAGVRRDIHYPWYPGDHLWVQEGYRIKYHSGSIVSGIYLEDEAPFRVTLTPEEYAKWCKRKYPYRASPGRFMYKSLSRITLEVKRVWVERVQDINEDDAKAEGVNPMIWINHGEHEPAYCVMFWALWDSIYGKTEYRSDANPWVWCREFERVKL